MKTILILLIAQTAVMVKPQGNTPVMPYPPGGKIPCSWINNVCWTNTTTSTPTTTPTTSTTAATLSVAPKVEALEFAVKYGGDRPLRTEGSTWRQGEYAGRRIKLGQHVTKNTRICSSNGDVLIANNDGQLAMAVPLNHAIIRLPKQDLRSGQLVYFGYAGGDTPGAQWRVLVGGRTSSIWHNLPICATVGCTFTDGTVTFKREALAPVDFMHGTVRLTLTCCANAYGCTDQNSFGQYAPNDSSLYTSRADNQASVLRGARNQVDVRAPFFMSMLDLGTGTEWVKQAGDPRIGLFDNEDIAWNTSFLSKWSTPAGIDPPELPPTVTLVNDPRGRFNAPEYQFSLVRIDKRWATPTAMSWRYESVRPSPTGQCIQISYPEAWPIPGGGSSTRQTRYFVCQGTRNAWGMWIDTLETSTDKVLVCSDAEMPERATCPVDGRANIPIMTIGNPYYWPNKWFPGMQNIHPGWTQVIPIPWNEGGQKDDGRRRVAVRVGCVGSCNSCTRGVTGTTGLVEPDWAAAGSDLTLDGNVCWMALPHYAANVHNGASIWLKPLKAADQYAVPGLLIDWNGVQVLDTNAKYPLSAPRLRGIDNAPTSVWYNPISWF